MKDIHIHPVVLEMSAEHISDEANVLKMQKPITKRPTAFVTNPEHQNIETYICDTDTEVRDTEPIS
jgi:hypothetical protein